MLLAPTLTQSHIISGDGLTKSTPVISAPSENYAENSIFAVVTGELFIFGGESDDQKVNFLKIFNHRRQLFKIARLSGCNLVDTGLKTGERYNSGSTSSAIEINNGEQGLNLIISSLKFKIFEALLCFDVEFSKNCEIFDTTSIVSTHSTQFTHQRGSLGYYLGQPTTVGSVQSDGQNKVETYSTTGWTSLPDSPRYTSKIISRYSALETPTTTVWLA